MSAFCRHFEVNALALLLPLLGATAPGHGQSLASGRSMQHAIARRAPVQPEDVVRRIGPLSIDGKAFTVVLHLKRLGSGTAPSSEAEETVVRLEIVNAAGEVQYQRSYSYEVERDHFVRTIGISARRLEGARSTGLLLTSDVEPSSPLGGGGYQVFGLVGGKLVPFGGMISVQGSLIEPEPPSATVLKTSTLPGVEADVLRFRVWTGNLFAVVPLRVDWTRGEVRPAFRCVRMTSRGPEPQCTFPVEAQRVPTGDTLSFVRLHAEPEEGVGLARHIVVRAGSQVEFLEGEGQVLWQREDGNDVLGVGDDVWLKVRIDGRDGWIHTQEDFSAIGLPAAG